MPVFLSSSAEDTRNFGKKFSKSVKGGQIFALSGEVGCGKTEFMRGVIEELSPDAIVSSPTFSIVNRYECADFTVCHFDFYRIKTVEELFEIGFEEYLSPNTAVFVEWADMYPQALGKNAKTISFECVAENLRRIGF